MESLNNYKKEVLLTNKTDLDNYNKNCPEGAKEYDIPSLWRHITVIRLYVLQLHVQTLIPHPAIVCLMAPIVAMCDTNLCTRDTLQKGEQKTILIENFLIPFEG